MQEFRRGDIVYVDLGQRVNSSVQTGIKMCLVLSNNRSNHYSKILSVCPMTSKSKDNPVHVKVRIGDVHGHFTKDLECLAEQITTVDKRQVLSKMGKIKEDTSVFKKINEALCLQLGLKTDGRENK